MIRSFRCPDTEGLAEGWPVPRFQAFERVARRKLRQLEIAARLDDLRSPPGNRLEARQGDRLPPVTPGERLDQEFLQPLGVSQYRLAKAIGVPASRISEIISGQRVITADTDLRLCRYLGLSPGYWLRAQAAHDTELACAEMGEVLAGIKPLVHG